MRYSRLRSAIGVGVSVVRFLSIFALLAAAICAAPARADNAQYFYDPDGRLVGVVDPVNGSAQYTYDATGNILSVANYPITAVIVVGTNPSTGAVGSVVTIGGTGFGTSANTVVKFNGTTAAPTAVTATSITVTVPAGATTGPVTVTAPGGTSTSAVNFKITSPSALPQITSLSPTVVVPGGTVTISGGNFDPVNSKVKINGRLSTIVSATATTIVASIPVVSSGRVTVEAPLGNGISSDDLIVAPPGYMAADISSAQRITVPIAGEGQVATATIGGGQGSMILFDASQGKVVSAVETITSLTSGQFVLYNPDSSVVSPSSMAPNQTNGFIKAQKLSQTGTYVLFIASGSGPGVGAAGAATIAFYDVPPVGGMITAGGAAATLTSLIPGQTPLYTFAGAAGQSVRLLTELDGSYYNYWNSVTITAPDGQTQIYGNSIFQTSISGVLTLPSTGTYTIQFSPGGPATGTVSFELDVPFTGTLTPSGEAVSQNLATEPGDAVILTFAGTAGQAVRLLTGLDGSFYNYWNSVTITAPDGQTQIYGNSIFLTSISGVLTLPSTGTYTVQFSPGGPATGTVSFELDVPFTGTLTPGGNAVTNNLASQPGDAVILTFAGTAGQAVRLLTQVDGSFYNYWNSVTVTAPDGQTQIYGNSIFLPNLSGVLNLPSTGTYTVQFSPGGPATGTVSLQLEVPFTGTLTAGGDAVTNNLAGQPGDSVILTFAGTAGQAVRLLTELDGSFYNYWNSVTITAPDGQTQIYGNSIFLPNLSGVLILPSTGAYTAQFSPGGPATGNVALQLEVPLTGTLVLGGASVTSRVTEPGDAIRLTFTGTAGQAVRLVTQPDTVFGAYWNSVTITAPDGQTQIYANGSVDGNNLTGVLTLPATGTYLAQFAPGGPAVGNVTMSLDQPISSTIILGGPPVASNITEPGDVVALSFTGAAGQAVRLVTQPDPVFGANWNSVTITEPDGQTQLYANGSVDGNNLTGVLTLPVSGTYVAQFIPGGPATGDVTMQLDVPLTGNLAIGGPTATLNSTVPGNAVSLNFAGMAGQPIELLTQLDPSFNAYYSAVTITEPDGKTQLYSNGSVLGSNLTGVLTLPTTGIYVVQFIPSGPAIGTVSMTLFDAGTSVLGGMDFMANIPAPGATAQLAFSGNAGSRVSLLTQADTSLRQGCFTIAVTQPGGTTPLYSNTQSSPTDFSQALTLPASGLYTMLLTPCGNATGNAALTLYNLPPDPSGSTTIGGNAASLTTTVAGQKANVTFPTASANQTANITVTADANYASACYNVSVTAPNGTVVNTGQGCGSSYSTGVLTLAASGSYAITIASVSTAVGNVTVGVTAQ